MFINNIHFKLENCIKKRNIKTTKRIVNAIKNAISRKIVELIAFFLQTFYRFFDTFEVSIYCNIFVGQKV